MPLSGQVRRVSLLRHQGQTFLVDLGDEEAVEGIPMVQEKAVQGIDMLYGDRK